MTEKNLWGKLPDTEGQKSPKGLLKEQGDMLYNATGGKLHGVVRSYASGDSIVNDLEIVATFINNYSVAVLKASHGTVIYPVEVENVLAKTYVRYRCNTYDEFEKAVETVLGSPDVRDVIASLIIQSR
jgi:hypothetical protein